MNQNYVKSTDNASLKFSIDENFALFQLLSRACREKQKEIDALKFKLSVLTSLVSFQKTIIKKLKVSVRNE